MGARCVSRLQPALLRLLEPTSCRCVSVAARFPGWLHLLDAPLHAGICMSSGCTPGGAAVYRRRLAG